MKTTIDIPEALYKKAKIQAIERGQTLKQIVLISLEKELGGASAVKEAPPSYWARRELLPDFARLQAEGAFKPKRGARPIEEIIDEVKADVSA